MTINNFETHGRRLLVEFTCRRCKTREVRPLEECLEEVRESGYRDLHDLHPPEGWQDGGFYYPLFCPECAKDYELFVSGATLMKGTDYVPKSEIKNYPPYSDRPKTN